MAQDLPDRARATCCSSAWLQPLGAVMPIAEAQAKLIAELLAGDYALPSAEVMQREMEREDARQRRRYVASPRHTMQIDFERYLRALDRERVAGRRRARRRRHSTGRRATMITASPSSTLFAPTLHMVSKMHRRRSRSTDLTVTSARTVSPTRTGARNFRVWLR